ncbi:phosphoribosyltransferase family protein [Halorubrum sp. DTA46]|uniref:phosphoribosyltransferase family protein n=1 Tax=Halorubrum sp. DTA46 TaxID=3402162 RepID=UPI003AAB71F7
MEYRSITDLKASVHQLARELSGTIDLVVGIPRSGLLAANLLSLRLDVPMMSVDGLKNERVLMTGNRYGTVRPFNEFESALVVDDSVLSGTQMIETKSELESYEFPFDVEYGAVYIAPWADEHVDHWAEVVPSPRVFEWNLFHHPALENACVDIDGVLCRDPTPAENDDGENYREFLSTVAPEVVPNQRIGWLVTARLEKYRPETEAWLDEHGIEYDELVMMDVPDMETRRERGNHAQFKSDVYDATGAALFIESDAEQADEIRSQTGKPVFCNESNEMLQPGRVPALRNQAKTDLEQVKESPVLHPARVGVRLYHRLRHQF